MEKVPEKEIARFTSINLKIIPRAECERRDGVDDTLKCPAVTSRTIIASAENDNSAGSDGHESRNNGPRQNKPVEKDKKIRQLIHVYFQPGLVACQSKKRKHERPEQQIGLDQSS